MKRKILLCIVGFVLTFGLVGCSKSDNSDDKRLEQAMEKNAKAEQADLKLTMDMNLKMGSEKQDISLVMDGKVVNATKDPEMQMEMSMKSLGQDVKVNAYFASGYMYMDFQGNKVKQKQDTSLSDSLISSSNFSLEPKDFKESKMTKDGDNYVYDFEVKPENMKEIFDKVSKSNSSIGSGLGDVDVDFNKMTGKITVNKDGYVSNIKMNMKVKMEVSGDKADVNYDYNIEFRNPGKKVEITPPADLEAYKETGL